MNRILALLVVAILYETIARKIIFAEFFLRFFITKTMYILLINLI